MTTFPSHAIGPRIPLVGAELVIERCGPHVLVRHRDEQAAERVALAGYRLPPGEVVVLASVVAHHAPTLPAALAPAVGLALAGSPARIWLAVSGLGRRQRKLSGWLRGISAAYGGEVLAPRGKLVIGASGELFVADGAGWARHRAGKSDVLAVSRFPVPAWEPGLPSNPVAAGGLVADPVPAGYAVRCAAGRPVSDVDLAFTVPSAGRPALVIGRPDEPIPPAGAVAALIAELPAAVRAQITVVLASGVGAWPGWLGALAELLGRDVLAGQGIRVVDGGGTHRTVVLDERGCQAFQPFATMVRCQSTSEQTTLEVVDCAPAPVGWSRHGTRHYRLTDPEAAVWVEVTPGGLTLDVAGADAAAPGGGDPRGWTLTVGAAGRPVTGALLVGVERLVAGVTRDQLRAMRIRVAGQVEPAHAARLVRIARDHGVPLDLPPSEPALPGELAERTAKADAAVSCYLGRGSLGAVAVNAALRAGEPLPRPDFLPTLVAALGRLPMQWRPVLRQARLGDAALEPPAVGEVLTEPGFLSASIALDVTIAGADVDYLIWPRLARRLPNPAAALGGARPIDEAVFLAGSRFRVLAVRRVPDGGADLVDERCPGTAVLLREVSPDDVAIAGRLAEEDLVALSILDRTLAERQVVRLRGLDDPELISRLSLVPIGLPSPLEGDGERTVAVRAGRDADDAERTVALTSRAS